MSLRCFFLAYIVLGFLNVSAQDIGALPKQKPVNISGNLSTNYTFITTTDTGRVPMPSFWNVAGNLNFDVYGVAIPVTLIVTNGEINFTHSFNQFGISPRYKWITLHLGYRQFNYSNFTATGQTFLGGGVDLIPGKFRLGFFYGRNRKSTPLDTSLFQEKIPGSYPLDVTTVNGVNRYNQSGSYARWGWGAKIGYGTENNFVDLILFKGKDREGSISDTFSLKRLTPEENIVGGLNTFQRLGKHVTFGLNAGASFYTYNTSGDTLSENSEVPLKGLINNLLTLRTTTQFQWAGDITAGITYPRFSLQAQYRHIEPYYRSMGINLFLSDLESISLQPSWSLFKQKVRFTNSMQLQKDNLNNYKQYTTYRKIYNSSVSINTSDKWGFDISFNNYGMNQRKQRSNAADSVKVFQHTNTFTFTPRYIYFKEKLTNITSLVSSYTFINGGGILKGDSNKIKNLYVTINNSITLNKSGLTLTGGLNYNNATSIFNRLLSYGVIVGASKSFLKNTLLVTNNNTYLWNKLDGNTNGNTLSSDLNVNYTAFKKHQLAVDFNYLFSPANGIYNLSDFKQYRTGITYQYTF